MDEHRPPLLSPTPWRLDHVPRSPSLSPSPGPKDEVEVSPGLPISMELEVEVEVFRDEASWDNVQAYRDPDLDKPRRKENDHLSSPNSILIHPPTSPPLLGPSDTDTHRETNFVCLTSATGDPPESESEYIPVFLLSDEEKRLWSLRRQSAPPAPLTHNIDTLSLQMGLEARRRASEGTPEVGHRFTTNDALFAWNDAKPSTKRSGGWLGLRRALSTGSTQRPHKDLHHRHQQYLQKHRRLSSVMEVEQPFVDMLTARARQLRDQNRLSTSSRSSPGPSRSQSISPALHPQSRHHRSSSESGTSNTSISPEVLVGRPVRSPPPGPVPSGPSSPSTPPHRDFSLVDGDLFALNFPRPPGRIVSGFSDRDMDPLSHPILIDYRGTYPTDPTASPNPSDNNFTRVDGSLIIPSGQLAPDDGQSRVVYPTTYTDPHSFCPPSPALTPSPDLSIEDFHILTTPGYQDVKDSVGVSNRKPSPPFTPNQNYSFAGSPLVCHPTPLSPRGSEASTTTKASTKDFRVETSPSTSSLIVLEKQKRNTFMASAEFTRPQPEGWYSDTEESVDFHPLTTLPSSHPFHHKPNPSVPYSTRTISTLAQSAPGHSSISPPPSYVQLNPSTLSRRHSKFTAFSGGVSSSSSSIYSASDTSSVRHNAHHWGLGEKPDISTVFEEEPVDVNLDLASGKGGSELALLPSVQRKPPASDLPSQPLPPKVSVPRGSSLLPSDNNSSSAFHFPQPRLDHPDTSSSSPINPLQQPTTLPHRTRRSDTVSSQTSANSAKSTRSQHPFASAVIRPTSPPPPLPAHHSGIKHKISSSRSQPNLTHALRSDPHMPSAPAHQVRVASAAEPEEEMCPVCVEPLSSNYRLEGERPHVFPECGHGLHHDCFTHVYGEVPPPGSTRNIGVCGICRQYMRITEGGPGPGRKKRGGNKFAALAGQQPTPSHLGSSAASITSGPGSLLSPPSPTTQDHNGDDPLVPAVNRGMSASTSSRSLSRPDASRDVIVPSITIKSEVSSISRTKPQNKIQLLTAMVTVVVPSAPERGMYPPKPRLIADEDAFSPQLPPSPRSAESISDSPAPLSARSSALSPSSAASPFAHVIADLRKRVPDYNTSGLDSLGPLRLFDILAVRKGSLSKDFNVYLFQDALICIQEEKKSGLRGLFSSSSSIRSSESSKHKTTELALKGRIFLKHVSHVTDSSVPGELTLTIVMVDERMDAFVLLFKDRGSHETWKHNLNMIVSEARHKSASQTPITATSVTSSRKIAQMMGSDVPVTLPRSASMPLSSSTFSPDSARSPSALGFGEPGSARGSQSSGSRGHNLGDLVHIAPLGPVHTPLDVVVILSLPAPNNDGESLPLKTRLMRESLQFMLALMGSRDRVSFVACEMGHNGTVRKTPFLNPTKHQSRQRLESFIKLVGTGHSDEDEFEVEVQADEKLDVVTAMNVALDVVLQRTVKNPIGSMILISDTSESIRRAQMELVTARLDAANLPVHSLGYGRGHDPSPLWMISNHTHGTYTFVREWYNLRDTIAGLFAGLMNIAVTNMRLHLNCEENDFKVLKVAGSNQSIIGRQGKTVEIQLCELRFGERREILVELDIDARGGSDEQSENRYSEAGNSLSPSAPQPMSASSSQGSDGRNSSIEQTLGLDSLSVTESSPLKKVYEGALIDEWPVTEVDCSWHDPDAGLNVHRLNHPVLLTCAILPPNAPPSSTPPDCTLVRRRMEVLASDMITRALLIASRKNYGQALKLLVETRKVIDGIRTNMEKQLLHSSSSSVGIARSKREQQVMAAVRGMEFVKADLEYLVDGLEDQREMFERDHRNFAAQQAVVYRDQKSWTTYTDSEAHYATPEVRQFLKLSADWTPEY